MKHRTGRAAVALVAASMGGMGGVVGVVGLVAIATPAAATTSVTLTVGPTGEYSTIQSAITAADTDDSDSGDDVTIDVAPGTYAESDSIDASGLDSLTIAGAAAATTTVNATGFSNASVVYLASGTVTISGLTLTGGSYTFGGGVDNNGAALTLSNDTITGNRSFFGGGVNNENEGTIVISDDTISDNSATDGGGGFVNNNSAAMSATVTDDLFSGDSGDFGGGIENFGDTSITDDTFTGDTSNNGGAVANGFGAYPYYYGGPAYLTDDTIDGESAADGTALYGYGGTFSIANSIFDSSTCNATYNDDGYNVFSDSSCAVTPGSGSVYSTDSAIDLAASLAANGSSGPETFAIGPDSSALDDVAASACTITTDARGEPRPGVTGTGQTSCDAGAYELQHTPTTLTQATPTSGSVVTGTAYANQLALSNSPADTGTVTYTTTSAASPVSVSPTGALSAPPSAAEGMYTISGTDTDPVHDTGVWSFTLAVGKTQTIRFTSATPSNATYGGTYHVSATGGGSGNPVTFSAAVMSVCSVSGATVTFTGVGTCTVVATQAGNTKYLAATPQSQGIVVGPAPTTLVASPVSLVGSLLTAHVTFSAILTSRTTGKGIEGQTVTFTHGSMAPCSATTNAKGVATCASANLARLALLLPPSYSATYGGGTDYLASNATGKVT